MSRRKAAGWMLIWCVAIVATCVVTFRSVAVAQTPTTTIAATQVTAIQLPISTTQNVIVVQAAPAPAAVDTRGRSITDDFANSTVGQVIRGERKITLKDILDVNFWVGVAHEMVFTILAFVPRLIGTLLFLFVFYIAYRLVRKVAVRSMKRSEVDNSIRDMLSTLIRWVVMGFGVVIACNQLGIPIVAMLTGVSIIGLAVGFAGQETIANFIAGIVVFLDKPFKVADWITIDGMFGQVKRVSFRSTRILNLDGEVVVLPNTMMLASKVINHSTHPVNRVSIPIGIAYKASISQAREVLLNLVKEDERIIKSPAAEVVVDACADSSVNLLLRFWIADEALERKLRYEYLEKAKNAFDAAGIEIPFPHVQLFLESTAALEGLKRAG